MAEGFRIATAYVQVSPDTDGFAEELRAKLDEATAGAEAKARVGLDTSDLDAKADEAKAKVEDLDGKTAHAKLGADASDLDAKTEDAKAKVSEVDARRGTAKLDADDAAAKAKIDELKRQLAVLQAQRTGIDIDADASQADVKIAELQAKIAALNEERAHPKADLDDSDLKRKVAEDKSQIAGLGALTAHPVIAATAGGIAGLMPGIGGAATGLGMLGGAGALAFGGIMQAVSAAHQASQNIGMTQQQLAATEYANSVQIQQAQQAVAQAHQQAAQDAVTSAQAIESAQMNLASVERNAAAQQIQAVQAVAQSKQGVEQANYGLSEAEHNLSQAYVQAREQIVSLNDALHDSQLNVKGAQLAYQQAVYQQKLVDSSAYSTALQREQAALAVAQAQQQITDATHQESDAQQAANQANQQGVNGSQLVIQAKQALKVALFGVKDAIQAEADAQRNLLLVEKNNAEQVKQAQMQVIAAQEQAAYTQMRDAEAVMQAQRNLTDTVKEQQLQWAATASTQNQAANQFTRDMARLTPAGRTFVTEILSMRGAFRGLEAAAQNAILPGVGVWLRGLASLMPVIRSGITQIGSAMGAAFAQFGKMMQTRQFAEVFKGLIRNGLVFVNTVLPAFAQFIQQLAVLGSKSGAVSGLANLLAGLGRGLTTVARSVAPFTGAFGTVFTVLGRALVPLGSLIGSVAGQLASALAPALTALLPAFTTLADALSQGLGTALQGVTPFLAALATALGTAVQAVSPILPVLGQMIGQLAGGLAPVLGMVTPVIAQLGQILVTDLKAGLGAVTTALIPLLPSVAQLANLGLQLIEVALRPLSSLISALSPVTGQFTTALVELITQAVLPLSPSLVMITRDAANLLTAVLPIIPPVARLATMLVSALTPAIRITSQALNEIVRYIVGPVVSAIVTFGRWLSNGIAATTNFATNVLAGFTRLVDDLAPVWHGIENVFAAPVRFLVNVVYDKGIAWLWNEVVTHIGLGKIKLPTPTVGFAGGGVVPGWSPGRDNHLAALSGGEGVLTPQATRAIGGKPTVDALNSQYPPSASAPPHGDVFSKMAGRELRRRAIDRPAEHAATFGMFAGGGIVGDVLGGIEDFLRGAGHVAGDLWTIGRMFIAALTGNTTAFGNALSGLIGTSAAGDLARIMVGVPKTLIGDLIATIAGPAQSGGGNYRGIGQLPANWRTIAGFLASHGFTRFAAAGVAGNIEAESGGNPEQLQVGGGGGGGLIQWTPYPPGYITGQYQHDLMTQLNAILSWGGGPTIVNTAISPGSAATIYQDYYERPANLTASLPARIASANAVYQAMGWGNVTGSAGAGLYDAGGVLPPGMTVAVNRTGQDEVVLSPQQARAMGGGRGGVTIVQNFNGVQWPNAEQKAAMQRELALMLG